MITIESTFCRRWVYACALLCGLLRAQDQVELIDDPLTVLTAGIPPNPRQLTYEEAKSLVQATLQTRYPQSPSLVEDRNFYCIIHTVIWKQATANSSVKVPKLRWMFNSPLISSNATASPGHVSNMPTLLRLLERRPARSNAVSGKQSVIYNGRRKRGPFE